MVFVLSDAWLSRVPVLSCYELLTVMETVIHHTLRDTKQNIADMISLNTRHDNDEANKRRFLLAPNLQPATRDLSFIEPHEFPMYGRSQELKSNPPVGNPLRLPQANPPGSEQSDQSCSTSSCNGFSSDITTESHNHGRSTSSPNVLSPDANTASNASDVADTVEETAVQRTISEPSSQNQELATSVSPASLLKETVKSSRETGLTGLRELFSSTDIPESILKTKITSLLMSDKGNDLTISDILKKVMELSKTNDELEKRIPNNVNTSGAPNCSENTNEPPCKHNDNTELRKLLFANGSMVAPIDHPKHVLHSYPSITPSQILTGLPLLNCQGRPLSQRAFCPVLPQHQTIIKGNTPELNPSAMPMSCGVCEYRTYLPTENGTVPSHPVLPSGQIAQTTVSRNNVVYPAAPPPYQQYPDKYCPDSTMLTKGRSISDVADQHEQCATPWLWFL